MKLAVRPYQHVPAKLHANGLQFLRPLPNAAPRVDLLCSRKDLGPVLEPTVITNAKRVHTIKQNSAWEQRDRSGADWPNL